MYTIKKGVMKKTILFSFIAGAITSASGALFYQKMNTVPSASPVEAQEQVKPATQTETEQFIVLPADEKVKADIAETKAKVEKESACRKMNEVLTKIKDRCGSMPFPGIDECIAERTERIKVDPMYKEDNLGRIKDINDLKPQYESLKVECGE